MGKILFGTAGWDYPDWKGIVYPPGAPSRFDGLAYLAGFFDVVEVNSSFYRPPAVRTVESWVRRTAEAEGFTFTLKLHRRFTHDRETPWSEQEADAFRQGADVLAAEGKLGAVLLQFPWSFRNREENRRWLSELSHTFSTYPLVAELRHRSWMTKPALDFVKKLGLGFCNIDQPGGRDAVEPTALATAETGYVRFHGRNAEAWFKKGAGRDERYNYLYSEEELAPWVPRIRGVAERAEKTFVIGNNHFKGQAPANILQLKRWLKGERIDAPPPLLDAFPFLRTWLAEAPGGVPDGPTAPRA
ncbi:MAG: DUF72 domain-containing protein [Planctomycetota bacterium]|jgi:uncharacterized protein YecE (DUF72 family)